MKRLIDFNTVLFSLTPIAKTDVLINTNKQQYKKQRDKTPKKIKHVTIINMLNNN